MNTHKLLENVLLEAERYLGLALTFIGGAAEFAEQNLEGCFAKRQLETARFVGWRVWLWQWTVLIRSEALLAEAETLFAIAIAKKNGWGWGVNSGEFFLSAASVS